MTDDTGDSVPDFVARRDHVIEAVVRFVRSLRREGVSVPASAGLQAIQALIEVPFDERQEVYVALRATLISRSEDLTTFDELFPRFWQYFHADRESEGTEQRSRDESEPEMLAEIGATRSDHDSEEATVSDGDTRSADSPSVSFQQSADNERESDQAPGDEDVYATTYSPSGSPTQVAVSPPESTDRELTAAIQSLTTTFSTPPGRRLRPDPDGPRLDVRRALRRSFSTGGTVLSVPGRDQTADTVRAVLLVDVSRSVLDTLDREFLVRFLREAKASWRHARIFLFDTDIEEVTESFAQETASDAVAALEAAETKWGGGTRIGNAVTTIQNEYPTAVDRRTTVIVISDGLEVGEVDDLATGMAWLARRAARVTWWNPLAGSTEYEPSCQGMRAAMPYVDSLFAFRETADLTEIARQYETYGPTRERGYEYDPRRYTASER